MMLSALAVAGGFGALASCHLSGFDPFGAGSRGAARPAPAGVRPPLEPTAPPTFRPILPPVEPRVRVRIARIRPSNGLMAPVRLASPSAWLPVSSIDGDGAAQSQFVLRSPAEVRLTAAGWVVDDGLGPRRPVEGVGLAIAPLADESREIVIDGTTYPGAVRLVARPDEGGYDIVNDVPLESYLPGVLARELYQHWHPQTFAAQAIAARSFACSEHQYFLGRRHYDLTNTQSSQAYIGKVNLDRAIDAAWRTRGLCLSYRRDLVPGYYSSSCGGRAASALDAIGPNPLNGLPPLRGQPRACPCAGLGIATWSTERALATWSQRLAQYGMRTNDRSLAALRMLQSIAVEDANANGRPTRYRLTDEAGGTASIGAARLVVASNGEVDGLESPSHALRSSDIEATTFRRPTARVRGRGFGHGGGLCQHGAECLAREGYDHLAIVEWYYPDAEIRRAYG
ncbi:MAG: SpoIID/LytB domain-containing protein [Phycisphaerales bacterium]|nr:SpoIID/LytB domain-containing protein [Phycisphaerales bacterium]